MSNSHVDLTVEDRVATITFSRPEHDNLINYDMLSGCHSLLEEVTESNADILVLRGEGEHFSIGRDKGEHLPDRSKEEIVNLILDTNTLLSDFDGVSIAMVRGNALGFACGLAVQCDLTIAADTAGFGFNEVKHGGTPRIILSYLEHYVNRKAALDLVLSGRTISAQEAYTMGLITRVVPEDGLESYTRDVIESYLDLSIDSLTTCKFYLREVQSVPQEELRDYVLEAMLS